MSFVENLNSLMVKHHISKATLSKEAGVPYTTIDGFCKRNNSNVQLTTLIKLASYFHCTLDSLVGFELNDYTEHDNFTDSCFCENLKSARLEKNITQAELATLIGIANSTYSLYESGKREPTIQTLKKLSFYLNISVDELLGVDFMGQRAELLKQLMDSKNMKVSDIAKRSGLSYMTVRSIFERGAEKAGYINVCKICNALDISANELEHMVVKSSSQPTTTIAHFDGNEYTEEELDDIRAYAEFVKSRRK